MTNVINVCRHGTVLALAIFAAAAGGLLWPDSSGAASVQASKDCSTSPCTVVTASFTIIGTPKTIQWDATYTGTPTQGHSFYLTTSPQSNLADIPLTTTGQLSGTKMLTAGTYYISIKLAVMGPGFYNITYNPNSTGEPHLTTVNARRYDFQAAGEFTLLREGKGMEIQVRQTPIATQPPPGGSCVSVNSALAARVGDQRVSYQPATGREPALQLRVDGTQVQLTAAGISLGGGGRVTQTSAPNGLRIDFPDGTFLFVTPGWWADQHTWFMNVEISPVGQGVGIAGPIRAKDWLPALPDGSSLGPAPASSHQRYVKLNQTFANSWRVSSTTSLFDYPAGTSTANYTNHNWPPEHPPCSIPGRPAAKPLDQAVAREACERVKGAENKDCVYDVSVTGNPGFAAAYALSQTVAIGPAVHAIRSTDKGWSWWIWLLIGGLAGATLVLVAKRLKNQVWS